jgi:hypothetical protein
LQQRTAEQQTATHAAGWSREGAAGYE